MHQLRQRGAAGGVQHSGTGVESICRVERQPSVSYRSVQAQFNADVFIATEREYLMEGEDPSLSLLHFIVPSAKEWP